MKSFLLFLLLMLTKSLWATLPSLPPGGTVTVQGVRAITCPEVAGQVVRDALIDFEIRDSLQNVLITGRLQDRVLRNPNGQMVFSPRLRDLDTPNGTAWIDLIEVSGFEGATLSAEYRLDASGQVAPNSITRTQDGDTVQLRHGTRLIVPPEEPRTPVLLTTETTFGLTGSVRLVARNDFGASGFTTTIPNTAALAPPPPPELPPVEEIRAQIPEVTFDKCVYEDTEKLSVQVVFDNQGQLDQSRLAVVICAESTGDMEVVKLQSTQDFLRYVGETELEIAVGGNGENNDGKLGVAPGELFVGLLSYRFFDSQQVQHDSFSSDWAVAADPEPEVSLVEVREGLSLTQNEVNESLGTLFVQGDVGPVQAAKNELLFFPTDQVQLDDFLARTGGTIVSFEGHPGGLIDEQTDLPDPGTAWFTVQMNGDTTKIGILPQLRELVGDQSTLSASNEETLALVATAMELWSEGFLVGLNPLAQLHDPLAAEEGFVDFNPDDPDALRGRAESFGRTTDDRLNSSPLRDENFGFRQCWAFMKMFDYDANAIPVGVIDSGFAPNPDFKTRHPLYFERNLTNGRSGIGSAQVPQEVGNSFFGDKSWHGNGSVTTISGVQGNRFGAPGIAAQVAVPKLYHLGLAEYALGMGNAIRWAVDDGCSVINISAGYPCRILSVLGNDNICTPAGRAAFSLKLGAAARAAAAAACAAGGVLDGIIPGLGTAVCASAIATAEATAAATFSTVFLGNTRGPVERAVDYATARGVPIVASAGNRLNVDALAPFVDFDNSDIDDWQVIPAVIPDVIAVGACTPGDWDHWNGSGANFYSNLHFHGDSVDIWAPIFTNYWAPESGTVDPSTVPSADHIRRQFGGTSCAAPVITGVIANMMAIDSRLDRRFVSVAQRPLLPGRIRDFLVSNAWPAGSPQAPDSADDRTLFQWNEETMTSDVIPMPASLVADLQRRRNYVNAWKTLREVARGTGLLEYETLGYTEDLGRDDQHVDTIPMGSLPPAARSFPTDLAEELAERDTDLHRFRFGSTSGLYDARFELTIPRLESPDRFILNRARGTLVGTTADEQTLAWEMNNRWDGSVVSIALSGSDTLYRLNATSTRRPAPPADRFDLGFGNNTPTQASSVSGWEMVPRRGGLEVEAWELCVDNLNIHRRDDRDCFRIPFPSELGVPNRCTVPGPWITIRVESETPGARIQVYSLGGGETRLLNPRSRGAEVRLECADYLGRLPLYVCVENASFMEYALKVRWSKVDGDLVDRLCVIRKNHGLGRDIPRIERFFPPEIPELIGSVGGLPDAVVNPNPAIQQPFDEQGRFVFSRLFRFDVAPGLNGPAGVLAVLPAEQSVRLEIVDLNNEVMAAVGTVDHGFNNDVKQINNGLRYLSLGSQQLPAGTYFVRLSGHRPGDQISLYPTRALLGTSPGLAAEDILSGEILDGASVLPDLGDIEQIALVQPSLPRGELRLDAGKELSFEAAADQLYRVEIQNEDESWEPFGEPILGDESPTMMAVRLGVGEGGRAVRVVNLESGELVKETMSVPVKHLRFQTQPGTPQVLRSSDSLAPGSWQDFGDEASFTGDGSLREWFLPVSGSERGFFRIEDAGE